jgi:hypothetical protein
MERIVERHASGLLIASHRLAAVSALMIGISGALAASASAGEAAAAGPSSVIKDGRIAYVITDRRWAVYQSPDGKEECPNGFNDGPAEQFVQLFPKDGPKRTVVETHLKREGLQWLPTTDEDPFPFKEASGKIAYGMNLDGKVKDSDFTSPEGEPGIDNQMFRAIGCVRQFRGPSTYQVWWYENEYVRRYVANRFMIEISGVQNLQNDDDVTVHSYRGRDDLFYDATGNAIIPGGTQRIDERWGKMFQSTWKGKIVNGTLITEPADVVIPAMGRFATSGILVFKGMRLHLKLTPQRAEGVMAGYTDIDAFNLHMNTSWPTDLLSQGKLSELSLYRELRRLADGYPDPETGQMTAISSALNVKFTQVYIVHAPQQQTASSSHGVRAVLRSSR